MKKALFCIFMAFAVSVGLFAQQPVVAVAPFNAISGISATDANMITRVFTIRLGNTQKVAFVDRSIVDRVLQEHRFQAGDWSNAQKTAELGKALNADWIVRGELEKFGSNILVTVQFYNIRTFRFMGGGDLRIANADAAYDNMDPLVNKLIEAIATAQATMVSKIYKIGDRGPAGGWIFYDKGVFSNGWRYLEAAPAENEFYARWGKWENSEYWGLQTDEAVGFGKQNTQRIVAALKKQGESEGAAQLCVKMNIDGFSDWFLPSANELKLMYTNLKQKGLGNFQNNHSWYWSSSEYVSYSGIVQRFVDGFQDQYFYCKMGEDMKDVSGDMLRVRAIRAF